MNETPLPTSETTAAQPEQAPTTASAPSKKKRTLIVAGAVAVLLAAGAAIGTPIAVHASQVGKYQATADELDAVYLEQAEAKETIAFGGALMSLQHEEAIAFQETLTVIGAAPADVIAAEDAAAVEDAATALLEELGEGPELTAEQAGKVESISGLADEIKEAQLAEDPTPEQQKLASNPLPVPFLTATVSDLLAASDSTTEPEKVSRLSDEEVNGEALEQLEATLTEEADQLEQLQQEADTVSADQLKVPSAVAGLRTLLTDTASTLPALAAKVKAAAPKGGKEVKRTVSAATVAAAFAEAAEFTIDEGGAIVPAAAPAEDADTETLPEPVVVTDQGAALLLSTKIKSYITHAAAAKKAHATAVAAEEAAAAAGGGDWGGDDEWYGGDGWGGNGGGGGGGGGGNPNPGGGGGGNNPGPGNNPGNGGDPCWGCNPTVQPDRD